MSGVLGIDPGRAGALAVVDGDRLLWHWLTAEGCPDGYLPEVMDEAVSRAVMEYGATRAVLERVGARPGQGVTSMFTFGAGWGLWRGILAGRLPVIEPTPATWARVVHRDIPGDDAKAKSVARACQLAGWPMLKARAKREAVADAACLAIYGGRS